MKEIPSGRRLTLVPPPQGQRECWRCHGRLDDDGRPVPACDACVAEREARERLRERLSWREIRRRRRWSA